MHPHTLRKFIFCPACGGGDFRVKNEKAKQCTLCGFVYYFNPSASVACFIKNSKGELLLVRRAKEPAIDTLDLPGGFADIQETAEEAVLREVKEETGLQPGDCRYLFSLPNIYPYQGFEVHTLDLFFECNVEHFDNADAADDAAAIVVLPVRDVNPDDFGLHSIKKAIHIYKGLE
ncbi:MAG: NUDIX domain-containing protein [Tannerellaceae bacterium]|nr:NUDIX domain-containing protein [Tannerellaceae bacterium]